MKKWVIVWEKNDGEEPVFTGYGAMTGKEIENLRENVDNYSPYDFATVDVYDSEEEYAYLKDKWSANWKEGKK